MKLPFDSDEAKQVNRNIFEMIYFAALESSMELSKKRELLMKEYKQLLANKIPENDGRFRELERELDPLEEELNRDSFLGSYSTYIGSPVSQGILQFDMWGVTESEHMKTKWTKLRKDISKYGVRNSLLLAPMPTASTSQILGNNECFEPFTSNIYIRRTFSRGIYCHE